MILRRAAVALSFSTILASPALATDEPPVVQAIFKSWESQYKIKPTYHNLTTDGDTVTIEGLEASVAPPEGASGGPSAKLSIGKLELKGVSDQGDGLFEIAPRRGPIGVGRRS